jgi:hypothetical protein
MDLAADAAPRRFMAQTSGVSFEATDRVSA